MTFDEHEPHDSPRLYIAQSAPRYAGVCTPHQQPGRWGPRIYFTEPVPFDPVYSEARSIVLEAMEAENPFNPREHVDRVFARSTAATGSWETYMRGEIAFGALASSVDDEAFTRYEIIIEAGAEELWEHFIAKRFRRAQWHDLNAVGNTVALSTTDIEDVRFFLAGHGWSLGTISFLTIVQRRSEAVAVVSCNWDDERFYFLDNVGVLDQKIAAAALANGLEVVADLGGSHVMSSAIPYYDWLQEWLATGARGLPRSEASI